MDHYVKARTAIIRRGVSRETRVALWLVSLGGLSRVLAGADPRETQEEVLEEARAVLHREAVFAAGKEFP